jgi:competence protein ComEC
MKLLNFTIIKLTLCLILGIILAHSFHPSILLTFYSTGFLFIALFISLLATKKQFKKTVWFGVLCFLSFISTGMLLVNIHNQQNHSLHYSRFIQDENDSLNKITLRIRDVLKSGNYADKYIVDILKVNGNNTSGKVILNMDLDSIHTPLHVDKIYITKNNFSEVNKPLNPHQFNYKSYLEKQNIYHQIYAEHHTLFKLSSNTHTLFGVAYNIREHINKKLNNYNFSPDELGVINALLLGQRQDISDDILNNYKNAGAVHILAVSGLHVGVVLLILSLILKPIERFKHGKLIKTILLILLLWSFAVIAGLSASVTRAVTMFSIVTIGLNYKRPTNIFNTLFISMFVLLLFKPNFLFDVGFQLSYLAVFSIVLIHPIFNKLWRPKNKIVNVFWQTFIVSMSVQFGIIPISLYYFHQFPSLFFVSNLVIIPALGLILGFGILVIVLAVVNILPSILADFYGYIISLMNQIIGWVAKQEAFLFKDIAFNIGYVLASYMLIMALIRLYKKQNYVRLKLVLIAVILVQCAVFYTDYSLNRNELIVFHKSRHSVIAHSSQRNLAVTHDFDSITSNKDYVITNYVVGNHVKSIQEDTIQSVYLLNKEKLLVIDSLGLYNVKSFKPDYVLLRQSPKINLNRLIDSINPKYILADGSNYTSYIKRWEATCKNKKRHFHQTGKNGAFVISY